MDISMQRDANCIIGRDYPRPIVDHTQAVKAARAKIAVVQRQAGFRDKSDKVYQNTLVGTDLTILQKELRTNINGVYSVSNDDAVNRLVAYVKENKLVNKVKAKFFLSS